MPTHDCEQVTVLNENFRKFNSKLNNTIGSRIIYTSQTIYYIIHIVHRIHTYVHARACSVQYTSFVYIYQLCFEYRTNYTYIISYYIMCCIKHASSSRTVWELMSCSVRDIENTSVSAAHQYELRFTRPTQYSAVEIINGGRLGYMTCDDRSRKIVWFSIISYRNTHREWEREKKR